MHARLGVIEGLRDALAGGSPPRAVFEEEETATTLPCFQYALGAELPGENDAKNLRERGLAVRVTARGRTLEERETLTEELELALLVGSFGAFEAVFEGAEFKRLGEGSAKNYTATYTLAVTYHFDHSDPSTVV